jgi:hypothetical protein
VLHMDIGKVDRDVAHIAIAIHVCCKRLFKVYHLFFRRITYVVSVLFGCCICFHTNVASVCSKCFIHFTCMLQVFYLDVTYVSHRCCTHLFQIFHMFQTYAATSFF